MTALWWEKEAWNQSTLELVQHLFPPEGETVNANDEILGGAFEAASFSIDGTRHLTSVRLLPPPVFIASVFSILGDCVPQEKAFRKELTPELVSLQEGVKDSSDPLPHWRYNFYQAKHYRVLWQSSTGMASIRGNKSFGRRAATLGRVIPWTEEEFEEVMLSFLPEFLSDEPRTLASFATLPRREQFVELERPFKKIGQHWGLFDAFLANPHLVSHDPSPFLRGESNWYQYLVGFTSHILREDSRVRYQAYEQFASVLSNPAVPESVLHDVYFQLKGWVWMLKADYNNSFQVPRFEALSDAYEKHPNFTGAPIYPREVVEDEMLSSFLKDSSVSIVASYMADLAMNPTYEAVLREFTSHALRSGSIEYVSLVLPYAGVVLGEAKSAFDGAADDVPFEWLLSLI